MTEDEKEFLLHEYNKLAAELAWMLSSAAATTQYAVLVAASVFTWLTTESIGIDGDSFCYKLPLEFVNFAWYIPFVVTILAGLVVGATHMRARTIGDYLRQVEARFAVAPLGWESVLRKTRPTPTIAVVILWAVLFGGTLSAAWKASTYVTAKITRVCEPAR